VGQQQRNDRVRFSDRYEAGNVLAVQLSHYAGRAGTTVLGLPRGGIAVAYPIARTLSAPLDVLLVRELSVPGKTRADLPAPGLVGGGGVRVIDRRITQELGIEPEELDLATTEASLELLRLEHAYHGDHDRLDVRGQTVIVVDDGLPSGAVMRPALAALRQQRPARIVVAVPVASAETCRELAAEADEVVWVVSADSNVNVATWYDDFTPVSDEQIHDLLARGRKDARTARLAGWQRSSAPSFTSLSPYRL